MVNKFLSFLGLARRAGKLTMGNDPVIESIQKKEAKVLLAAADLSPRTLKGVAAAAAAGDVRLIQMEISMDELGFAIGKRVGIVSVNDAGFAKKIEQLCDDMKKTAAQAETKEEA